MTRTSARRRPQRRSTGRPLVRVTVTPRRRSTARRRTSSGSDGRFWGRALLVVVVLLIVYAHARGQA